MIKKWLNDFLKTNTEFAGKKITRRGLDYVGFQDGDSEILCFTTPDIETVGADYAGHTNDGSVWGYSTTLTTARTTAYGFETGENHLHVGMTYAGSYYTLWRSFLKFDTSAIDDGATVSNVKLKLTWLADNSDTDFDISIINANWSAADPCTSGNMDTVYDACHLPSSNIGSLGNSSSYSANNPITSGNITTSVVSKTGYTYIAVVSQRERGSEIPSGAEHVQFASQDHATSSYRPVLIVTLSSPSASISPSESPSISPSESPSISPSESPSISPSLSPSLSSSISFSPSSSASSSESPSISLSISPSLSPSESPSQSPSASISPSESPSLSTSESPSISESKSPSISPSISEQPSISPSISESISPSISASRSPSLSPSYSPSASISPSISPSVSPPATEWWNPSTLTLTKGTIVSGTLKDVYLESDETNLQLSEIFGTNISPELGGGFTYDFEFGAYDDIPYSNLDLHVQGYYEGNPTHKVKVQIWNYTTLTWDNVTSATTDFPNESSEQDYEFYLPHDADYRSSGNIKIRLWHLSTGLSSHYLYLNRFYLQEGGISHSISPSLSPSKSPSLSPSISTSISPSQSPSTSISPSLSPSLSLSVSPSASISPSLSQSLSPSISLSISPSESPSVSASASISPSASPSLSESVSPSLSKSISPSVSPSPSISPSISPSASSSLSPSISTSRSPSISPSVSPSPSIEYGMVTDVISKFNKTVALKSEFKKC
jgi:hypothetical protein